MELSLISTITGDVSFDGDLSGELSQTHSISGTIVPAGSGGSSDDGHGNIRTNISAVDDGAGNLTLFDITATATDGNVVLSGETQEPDGEISATLSVEHGIDGTLSAQHTLIAELVAGGSDYPVYQGPYEFTPSYVAQIVSVGHTLPSRNITINPVPQNYGLITWNGATLTVS